MPPINWLIRAAFSYLLLIFQHLLLFGKDGFHSRAGRTIAVFGACRFNGLGVFGDFFCCFGSAENLGPCFRLGESE